MGLIQIDEWPARRCNGESCRQGRAECKTPQACEVPERERPSPDAIALLGVGAMLVSAILSVLFFSWLAATAWEWVRPVLVAWGWL